MLQHYFLQHQNKINLMNKSIVDLFCNLGVIREQCLALINKLGLSDMTRSTIEILVDNRREKN
jgi:hypothetical protein